MFGMKEIEQALERMSDKLSAAIVEGFEKGAKILGDIIVEKMNELHEREKDE